VEYLNSYAAVYVDGRKVGEIRFPAGQVDLSAAVRPGATHVLSLLVVAMPLKAVMESYNDTNTARQRKGSVERRGLCGDVWLIGEPAGARLSDVRISKPSLCDVLQRLFLYIASITQLNAILNESRFIIILSD
jgi:DNA-binding TFAR19-related protein (PDSD5 family)